MCNCNSLYNWFKFNFLTQNIFLVKLFINFLYDYLTTNLKIRILFICLEKYCCIKSKSTTFWLNVALKNVVFKYQIICRFFIYRKTSNNIIYIFCYLYYNHFYQFTFFFHQKHIFYLIIKIWRTLNLWANHFNVIKYYLVLSFYKK